ncbi:MAG: 50S ribosomal protein L11 methyltransferase [Lachnospiraceae bacterium]|nr:50S ribosomal protein L11 methyltransferase [Lachnospiraceae bacterium]
MEWIKYRLKTTVAAEELIASLLADEGLEGVEIEDKVQLTPEEMEKLFIDMLPDLGEDDGTAYVSFYLPKEDDEAGKAQELIRGIRAFEGAADLGELSLEKSETRDSDWINNWKQYWKPFYAGDGILVKPTWEELPEVPEGTIVVDLDPGTAFGTGLHETTRLCISQIRKHLAKGGSVLDVGCGSGILSIISRLLGAGRVYSTDVDPEAVRTALENAQVNNIDPEGYRAFCGDITTDEALRAELGEGCYDIVAANIFADVIIGMAPVIGGFMKPDGHFISSGIINTKEEAVTAALKANGFEIEEAAHDGDWCAITARLAQS